MDTRTALYTGGCQCGSIRYSIFAPPAQPLAVCHCRMCQKTLGCPSGVFVAINLTDFQWKRGSATSFQSSSLARRIFCAQCGTPLAYQSKVRPFIDICLGTFDHPKQFGKPEVQMGVESCLGEWALVQDVLRLTTDQLIPDTVLSYQHPDKDTDDVEWQQMSENKSIEK
ncbi:hypothetical protein I4U23_031489 [Adineta vaga]|nr:hypothetical protein I4U23_031489 [Adineta vaga]